MWKIIGATVTGTSHRDAGTDCQDAAGWRSESGIACLAVADGAGSRPLSAAGSALAVERALLAAAECADPLGPLAWIRAAFDDAHEHIAALAASAGHAADDYATTLALAVITDTAVAVGQVGDSIAVVGGPDSYRAVDPEVKGEYVNETFFITQHDWLDHLRVTVMPAAAVSSIALSTDGLRYKILANPVTGIPFDPFFDDLVSYARGAEADSESVVRFLASLDDQTGDDKSLVTAVRVGSADNVPDHGPSRAET
jgi:hypothetical protein